MYVNNVNSASSFYTSTSNAAARYAAVSNVGNVQRRDELTLSQQAQSFQDVLKKLQNESEVRQAKVDEYAQKIASGMYSVSSSDIAKSILASRF
ncbi:MAG: flagellar biosynthesis anti-sigma factor FlgM [Selenomonadaceae bacterium]|nr:flagellar biosynthesis anti-sigma factor FlgM [Selenomonadaceae bacterium]